MKANAARIEQAVRAPPADVRFLLLHGPDEAGSRALMKMLASAMGADAERVDLSGAELKADPARLADEAASMSLFGGARYVLVEPAGEEVLPAVEALLQVPMAGNPVVIIAGALRSTSKLLQLTLAAPDALAFASYPPKDRDADRLVMDLGRGQGLIIHPELARRIHEDSGGNRALVAQEIEKLALYVDAAPDRPRELDETAYDAIGAATEGSEMSRMVNAVASGDGPALQAELRRLSGVGMTGVPLVRAVKRHFLLLARLRAEVDKGSSPSAVMASQGRAVHFSEKDVVGRQLARWRSYLIAKGVSRLAEAELKLMSPGAVGPIAVDEEFFAIARQAARLR